MNDENLIPVAPQPAQPNPATGSAPNAPSSLTPTSEDEAPSSRHENASPTASPSPGGEGRGEGELTRSSGHKSAQIEVGRGTPCPPSSPTPVSPDCGLGTVDSGLQNNSEHALFGKIARLPHAIREELNQRLLDGQSGLEILPWLNELPAVKEILRAQFDGVAIHKQNLTVWRQNGFQRWLREKRRVSTIKERCQYAAQISEADAGHLAPAAAAVASDKILECLDAASAEDTNPDSIIKYAAVASNLAKTEQNNARIKIANERLRQRELLILLKRDKQQRDSVAHGLRLLGDARAKLIQASSATYAEKIELLGIHMYGDDWEPRLVPTSAAPEPPPQTTNRFGVVHQRRDI